MPMSSPRWTAIAESQFPWEREALDWLRAELPNCDPRQSYLRLNDRRLLPKNARQTFEPCGWLGSAGCRRSTPCHQSSTSMYEDRR